MGRVDVFDEVETIRLRVDDPAERWRRLSALLDRATGLTVAIAAARTEVVLELLGAGLSMKQVGDLLGVSKTRVAQIAAQRTA
jgi:hypothetical protein